MSFKFERRVRYFTMHLSLICTFIPLGRLCISRRAQIACLQFEYLPSTVPSWPLRCVCCRTSCFCVLRELIIGIRECDFSCDAGKQWLHTLPLGRASLERRGRTGKSITWCVEQLSLSFILPYPFPDKLSAGATKIRSRQSIRGRMDVRIEIYEWFDAICFISRQSFFWQYQMRNLN